MTHSLILTAAGSSSRMGSSIKKEYILLPNAQEKGVSVLSEALYSFLKTGLFSSVVITHPLHHQEIVQGILMQDTRLLSYFNPNSGVIISFTPGGDTRQRSVLKGLEKLFLLTTNTVHPKTVLIHDGARPWVSTELIERVIEGLDTHSAVVPATQPIETQKEISIDGKIIRHLKRASLASVQTPQGFLFLPLLEAHRKAASDGETYTDDTEIWGRYIGDVFTCQGTIENKKITYKEDFS